MPNPTVNNARVDQLATDIAVAYGQKMEGFVGDDGATLTKRNERSGKYPIWNKADMFRSEMGQVANNDPAPVGGLRLDTPGTLYAETYGLKTFLSDKDKAEGQVDIEKGKIRWLVQQAKLKREILYAAAAFATGLWTSNTEQTGKTSSPSTNEFLQFGDESSIPLTVIQTQLLAVETSTGLMPNTLVTNSVVDMALRRHPDVLDLYKYTKGGVASREQVAAALGVQKYIVGRAVKNTANEGQSASMARVFGNHILLAYLADTWTEDEPTAVAGFSWSEYDKVDATGAAIRRWRENDPQGEWFHSEMAIVYKIVANDLGVFLKDAVI